MGNSLDFDILNAFQATSSAMHLTEKNVRSVLYEMDLPELDELEREQLSGDGMQLAENFEDDNFEMVEPQQFMMYKKRFVVLYIKDQYLTQQHYQQHRYNPIHICWCDGLQEAKNCHRYDNRYVMTYNTTGSYKVNLFVRDRSLYGDVYSQRKEQNVKKKLRVCQDCLYKINWKNFRSYCGGGSQWWIGGNAAMRNKIADEFDLEEYLREAKVDALRKKEQEELYAHPVAGTASSHTLKQYQLTQAIKHELKKLVDCQCEICGQNFDEKDLQIHHRNHNEGDNRRENLLVVCSACHAKIHEAEGGFTKAQRNEEVVSEKKYADMTAKLAYMYGNGLGIEKDSDKAKEYEELYQECEEKPADFNDNKQENAELCKYLAQAGDADAAFQYAEILQHSSSEDMDISHAKIAAWYYEMARKAYLKKTEAYEEMFKLTPSELAQNAIKGDKNALRNLEKLAQTNPDAMYELALVYADGGVDR